MISVGSIGWNLTFPGAQLINAISHSEYRGSFKGRGLKGLAVQTGSAQLSLVGGGGLPLRDCFPGETRDFMCPPSQSKCSSTNLLELSWCWR